MKVITLNTWGGRAGKEKLLSFFNKYRDIDIFCLQEIWSAPHEHLDGCLAGGVPMDYSKIMTQGVKDISDLLDNHFSFFRPHFGNNYGLLMLVKKNLVVQNEGEIFVHKEKGYLPAVLDGVDAGNHARNIQYVTSDTKSGPVTTINFHGLWNGKGKTDSEDRLLQSDKIIKFIKTLKAKVVLCGDFNLLPDTKSLEIIEKSGLINLIKKYDIKSTRTGLYSKPEKYADYCFVNRDIKVKDFKVLPEEVSDHAPLYIEFE